MSDKTIVIRLVARASQYTGEMRRAGAETAGFAVQVSRGAEKAGSSVKALGAASAMAGKLMVVGIGGAMAVSAKAAIEFESALAGVSKTVDFTGSRWDAAASPIHAYGEALRSLSMRIPITANELAKISEVGGQLGINTDNLLEFTETMAMLGVATNMSAEEAATSLARFANIMRTPQTEFDRLGSVVVELGNNFATTESEILTFATRIASSGQVIGATEADILAISAALTSVGVPAERGGTAVQRVFIDMANAVSNGGDQLDRFAKVAGVSANDFATAFQERPAQAFEMFIRGLNGITESGGNVFQTLDDLGLNQVRTAQVMLATAGGVELLSRALSMAEAEWDTNNALVTEAGERFKTTESQIQLAVNAFNDLRIEVGDLILGSGGLQFALDVMRAFFGEIKDNLPVITSFVSGLMVLGGLKLAQVFMTAATKIFSFVAGLKGAGAGLKTMGILAGTLNLALLGAAGAAGILFAMWANNAVEAAKFRQITRRIADDLENGKSAAQAIVDILSGETFGGFFGAGARELFDDKSVVAIQDLFNMSPEQFIQGLLEGRDLLGEVTNGLGASQMGVQHLLKEQGKLGQDGAWLKMEQDISQVNRAIHLGQEFIDGYRSSRIIDMTSHLREQAKAAGYNSEQLRIMAGIIFKLTNGNATNEDAFAILFGGRGRNFGRGGGPRTMAEELGAASGDIQKHWTTIVEGYEGGAERLEGAFGDIDDIHSQWTDSTDDFFDSISKSIRDGFPAWDEYEQMATLNLEGVRKAQGLFLADTRNWVAAQGALVETASETTLNWLDGLDMPTKGALGRLFATDRPAFDAFIAQLNSNFDQVAALTGEAFGTRFPLLMTQGTNDAMSAVMGIIDMLELDGAPAAQMFTETFMGFLAAHGLTSMFADSLFATDNLDALRALFRNTGFDLGGAITGGIIAGIKGGYWGEVHPELEGLNKKIKDQMKEDFWASSPSKWMIQFFRDDVMGGAAIGVQQGLPNLLNLLNGLPQQALQPSPSPIVNVASPGVSRNSEINIIHPNTRNLKEDLRLGTVMAGSASEFGG